MDKPLMLVLNLGSTSTKVAVFQGTNPLFSEELPFMSAVPLNQQLGQRRDQILGFLEEKGVNLKKLKLIMSRGGLIKPLPAGIYAINDAMCDDLAVCRYGVHPSGLGPLIARELAAMAGTKALTMDPPSTDEFQELARVSGLPEVSRISALHALSQKAAGRLAAEKMGIRYDKGNFVVAHLGGGITIGAHLEGRVIDSTHGISEGPLTPERSGALPSLPLADMVYAGTDKSTLHRKLAGEGGLAAYLGTKDAREVEKRIASGDAKARLIYEAMAYQIAKEIGAMATVLKGRVDAVVLTGGLSRSTKLTAWVRERVEFIAPVLVIPENEMLALAAGGVRALAHPEQIQTYTPE